MCFCSFVGWTEWYLTKIGQKPNGFDSSLHLRIFVFAKLASKPQVQRFLGIRLLWICCCRALTTGRFCHGFEVGKRLPRVQKRVKWVKRRVQNIHCNQRSPEPHAKIPFTNNGFAAEKFLSRRVTRRLSNRNHVRLSIRWVAKYHIGWSPWLWQSTIPEIGKLQLRNRFIAGSKAPFCIICMQWSVVCRGRQSTVWYWMMILWRLRAGCRKPCKTSRTWNKEPMEAKENIGQFWNSFSQFGAISGRTGILETRFRCFSSPLWEQYLVDCWPSFADVEFWRLLCGFGAAQDLLLLFMVFGPRAKPIWTGWWGCCRASSWNMSHGSGEFVSQGTGRGGWLLTAFEESHRWAVYWSFNLCIFQRAPTFRSHVGNVPELISAWRPDD